MADGRTKRRLCAPPSEIIQIHRRNDTLYEHDLILMYYIRQLGDKFPIRRIDEYIYSPPLIVVKYTRLKH